MKDKFKLIVAMLIYGSIGIFVRNINYSPGEIAILRAIIGSLFLLLVCWTTKKGHFRNLNRKQLIVFSISGGLLGINWYFLFKAFDYLPISTAILIYYLAPIIVILLSPIFLKDKLTIFKLLCATVAIIGLSMVLLNDSSSSTLNTYNFTGILFALSAALFYASVILINKLYNASTGLETTTIQLGAAALVLLPILIAGNKFNGISIDTQSILMMGILGILHTGIAYLLYFSSMKNLSAHTIALYCYIDPISAMVFAWLIIGEKMNLIQIIGAILILVASYFIDYSGLKKTNLMRQDLHHSI